MTLRLAPKPAHVRTARLVASAMARRSGVAEDLLDDVRLAVGEACARAVLLHERHAVDQPVTLELSDGDMFSVTVVDGIADATGAQAEGNLAGLTGDHADVMDQEAELNAAVWATAPDVTVTGPVATGELVLPENTDEIFDTIAEWADPVRLGLAVLAGVVDSLTVERGDDGTRVRMCWPATR